MFCFDVSQFFDIIRISFRFVNNFSLLNNNQTFFLSLAFDKSLESSPRLSRDSPEKQDSYDNLEDAAGSPTTHEFASDAFDDTG